MRKKFPSDDQTWKVCQLLCPFVLFINRLFHLPLLLIHYNSRNKTKWKSLVCNYWSVLGEMKICYLENINLYIFGNENLFFSKWVLSVCCCWYFQGFYIKMYHLMEFMFIMKPVHCNAGIFSFSFSTNFHKNFCKWHICIMQSTDFHVVSQIMVSPSTVYWCKRIQDFHGRGFQDWIRTCW